MKQEKYFVTKQGTIVNEYNIKLAAEIAHGVVLDTENEFDEYIERKRSGILFEVASPRVEDFLLNHQKIAGIRFYYNSNKDKGVTLGEARDYVEDLEAKMKERGEL